jgi:CBS domain containing-hemolysin-like protein
MEIFTSSWSVQMTLLIISIPVILVVSAVCSLSEAALYSVRLPYVRRLAETGSASGRLLAKFKQNMEQPISTILIVNTAGAAVAGGQARILFGEAALVWFSAHWRRNCR